MNVCQQFPLLFLYYGQLNCLSEEYFLKIQEYSIIAVSIHLNIFSQTFHLTLLFPNWLLIKPERGLVKYCI